ncbi:MAG TPA: hypothetical protein DET40_14320 [Lentisphaeria bacterium]|nr:MAG: hypothetical protein A2X45_05495 [Lentisphaerae bacterium GWF2_50_93]HCE44713.1 hypothetical protein [Lentisphaeria bacterium]
MKMQCLMAGILFSTLVLAGCQSAPDGDVDSILAKMRKAMDPGDATANITTQVITSHLNTPQAKDAEMVVEVKYPSKMRIKAESKDAMFMKGYDGKTGWEFSTKKGLREIKGKELDNMKFQIVFLSPKEKARQIFESITLAGEETVNRKPCYKLVCKPMPAYSMEPMNIYVDKKTYFIAKTEEIHNGPKDEPIEMTRYFMDYKKTDGVYFPMKIISEANGNIIECIVTSIEWNVDLSDTAFDMPDEIK